MENNSQITDSVVSVRRVTKVTKGGKRFAFSAFVVSGDKEGRVGVALGRSREVSSAIAKATVRARKKMIQVPLKGVTIPYPVVGTHRIPFSTRFFLLAIIFIVFDIEIVLLIPIPIIINITNKIYLFTATSIFLIILIVGLLHE